MATIAKLKEHIAKAKTALDEEAKKTENPKTSLEVRLKRKKFKRLSRKAAKMEYREKKAEEKKKKKKEQKTEG